MSDNQIALQLRLSDIVEEYNKKKANIPNILDDYKKAVANLTSGTTISNAYGNSYNTGHVYDSQLEQGLLKSAWRHIYDGLNIARISSASDKRKFEQSIEHPIEFTMDNIRATFGDFVLSPRKNILRGLAEIFCSLDASYKSHDKVKIGVSGLPKRIILSGVTDYGWSRDRITDVVNSLAAYQNKPLVGYGEISDLLKNGDLFLKSRGIRLVRYKNNNAHLFFEPQELKDINHALAEYYGEVLADTSEEKPVSKDLQYYPTPKNVVQRVLDSMNVSGEMVLEPSCGCGRFLDELRNRGASVYGIEYDVSRANQARAKGHSVYTGNFLETAPEAKFDRVIMNPPFYGKHYAKHVEHALKFLKPNGRLTAILPITARYDHGLLEGRWEDLPVGSFSESGTNINTTILTIFK